MITSAEILKAIAPASADPTIIDLLIARATATLGRELGYYLGPPKEVVQFYDGRRAVVWLNDEPNPGTPFTLERSTGVTDPYALTPTTAYVVEGRRITVSPGYFYPAFRVTYTIGYDPAKGPNTVEPPAELAALVRHMVLDSLEAMGVTDTASVDLQSETIGDYSYTRGNLQAAAAAIGDDWPTFVKRWRRLRL